MSKIKIMLDPGHFGSKYNQSPVLPSYYESNFTWAYHLLLKAALEKTGAFEVFTTRANKNDNPEVTQRGKMSKDCDLFISLHSDASSSANTDRVTVYHQIGSEEYALLGKQFAEFTAPVLNDAMDCVQACAIKTRLGSRGDYYGVLRGSAAVKTPGVIIEHSYHTNLRNAKWLSDEENLKALAEVTSDTICEFFGVEATPALPLGDVNGDGRVNATDYAMAKRILMGTYTPSAEELARCDVNGDGKVTATDYAMIKRIVLGTYTPKG